MTEKNSQKLYFSNKPFGDSDKFGDSDRIVFDIETKNSFADVGGEKNVKKLEVSVVGVYSYEQNQYFIFDENEFSQINDLFKKARLLIGFSSKHFDVPVLEKYLPFNLSAIPHFDILEEIEKKLGRRIGLNILAQANVGSGKNGSGLDAIDFYRKGEMEKLKNYCLQDVKLTKEIFDLIKVQKYLWIPQKNVPQMIKLEIIFDEGAFAQNRLI